MFVIARYYYQSCEVYDSITNKFTIIKRNPHIKYNCHNSPQTRAISIGYKIHVFQVKELKKKNIISAYLYDVEQETWIPGDNYNTKFLNGFSCAKMFIHNLKI